MYSIYDFGFFPWEAQVEGITCIMVWPAGRAVLKYNFCIYGLVLPLQSAEQPVDKETLLIRAISRDY